MNQLTIKSVDKKLKIEIQKRSIDNRTGHIGFQFQIGPFKKSMAGTIGSALRRTLLSLSQTVAVTSAFGNLYEGNALREDLFELSLNLQKIIIKSSLFPYMGVARIRKTGPAIITAQDLLLEEGLRVVNPYQYICTLNESYSLDLSLVISSPNMNQGINLINTLNPLQLIESSYFQNQQNPIKLAKSLKNESQIADQGQSTSQAYEDLLNQENILAQKKVSSTRQSSSKNLKKSESGRSSSNELNNNHSGYQAQKVPVDIILVDPIYSAIQSCSFEIGQTTKSSVLEYDKLVEYGITDTDEFLQFSLISRGSIEPVDAIQFAAAELRNNLVVFETLPHLFASENNLFSILEKNTSKLRLQKFRSNLSLAYTKEIIKNLDIRHLGLPPKLELFLRRQGFVNLENITDVPLSFLKKIGLEFDEFLLIEAKLANFGLSRIHTKKLIWEFIPPSLKNKI